MQIEFGTVATDFEFISPHDQLAECLRFYQEDIYDRRGMALATGGRWAEDIPLVVAMRAEPTITFVVVTATAGFSGQNPAIASKTGNAKTIRTTSDFLTASTADSQLAMTWTADAEL